MCKNHIFFHFFAEKLLQNTRQFTSLLIIYIVLPASDAWNGPVDSVLEPCGLQMTPHVPPDSACLFHWEFALLRVWTWIIAQPASPSWIFVVNELNVMDFKCKSWGLQDIIIQFCCNKIVFFSPSDLKPKPKTKATRYSYIDLLIYRVALSFCRTFVWW